MSRRGVEIRQAWEWTCDECGRDNFERAVLADSSAIDTDGDGPEAEAVRDWMNSGGEGRFLMVPRRVTCPRCGVGFDTTPV